MRHQQPVFFKVIGKGSFPLDMLRYDECHPVDAESVENIKIPQKRERVFDDALGVEVVRPVAREARLVSHKRFGPTEERWNSFGWKVEFDHWWHPPA